jgi:GH15 family glucan-1,4-alpha-glucosidase
MFDRLARNATRGNRRLRSARLRAETRMQASLELAVVGNCSWGGLIDRRGRLVWACLPRFDSDPVFPALLDPAPDHEGTFSIELVDFDSSEQHYDGNTAILVTVLRDREGNALEIRDFAPRFVNHRRFFRPTMLVRRLLPLRGEPRIRIWLRPRCAHGGQHPATTRGSNHLRFVTPDVTLRLTTDAPISYVTGAVPFVLEKPLDLILGPDEILAGAIDATAREFEERTRDYWTEWSRTLSIPFEWQDAVIRAAISLKLCHFEETGAIVAALTTSVPEAPDTGRNWDYRYCWLRDAYFVIHALNGLGATKTMEAFLSYIENLAASADGSLQPVYGIALESDLVERIEPGLAGYRGMGPVRVGNQAYLQPQHDVYGSLVLAATHSFFDRRLLHRGGLRLFETLEAFGERAARLWDQPDAGLWELRTRSNVHTFSAAMCWAACDRLAKIALRLGESARAARWRHEAERIRAGTLERGWSEKRGSFVATFGGEELDASLLLLHEINFVAPEDPRFAGTVAAIEQELRRGPYLLRYAAPDDFGPPRTAFNICTFWYIGALAALGRRDEARELFENMLARRNALGLLSEDLDPVTGELWGNFPQTYSMVGLINAATRLSKGWEEAF